MSWICLNAQWAIASGAIQYETKELNTDQCNYEFTLNKTELKSNELEEQLLLQDTK